MSLQEAERQCFILTVGSQDTSAAFISAFINFLLEFPEACSKLLDEISLFEREGKLSSPIVTYEETVGMRYFMACIHETLRLSPPVSMILPRYAPPGGMCLYGIWISDRTEIAANPYVVHRNTEVFGPDANTFHPGRWLGDQEHVQRMHKLALWFGYGSRKCLGRNIALFESQKFIVQVGIYQILGAIEIIADARVLSCFEIFTSTDRRWRCLSKSRIGASTFISSRSSSSRHEREEVENLGATTNSTETACSVQDCRKLRYNPSVISMHKFLRFLLSIT